MMNRAIVCLIVLLLPGLALAQQTSPPALPSNLYTTPSTIGSSSASSAPAVQSGHIFLDPTCPTIATATCFFWNGDVRIYVDATTTSGSNILTISGGDTSFLSTETLNNSTTRPWIKVGQRIICSTSALNGSMVVGVRPGGVTVTSIDSATQIHISSNALSNQTANAFCAIGDDDTANINAFWNSGMIPQCGVNGYVGLGIGFINSGIFNTVTAACLTKFNNQYSQPGIFGPGLGGATFMPLETFDFTTGAGNSCQGGGQIAGGVTPPSGSRTLCIGDFFSEMSYINVWGLGLTPVTTGLTVGLIGGNSRFNTDSFQGWMGNYVGSGAVYGLVENGNQVRVAQSCSCQFGEVEQVMNAQSYQIGNFTFGGLTDIQAIPGGGVQPSSSYTSAIGPTNGGAGGAEISINAGAVFNDFGDHLICSNTDLACHFVAAGGTGNFYAGVVAVGGSGTVFKGNGAAAVTRVQDSAMTCSGAGCTEINMAASATFYDHGGNTWTTFGTAFAGAGNVANQLSADVGPCVTGNWALTSGWGTATVNSVGANGNSHKCRVVINVTVQGTAGPVLTWTFPTAYPNVAPSTCHIFQVGGTTFNMTNASAATASGGSVAFTFTGETNTVQTYTFDGDCGP